MAGYITRKIQNNFISDKVYCSPTWCNLTNAPIPDNRYINSLTNTIDPKMDYFIGIRLFFSSSMRRKKKGKEKRFHQILKIYWKLLWENSYNTYITKQSIFGFPKSVIPILKIRTGRLALIGCSLNRRYTHDRRIIKIIDKPSASKTHVVYIQLRSRRSDRASLHARSNNRPCSVFLKKAREKSIGEIIICHRSSRGVSRNRLDPACKKVDVPTTVGGGNWLVKKRKEGGEKGKKERKKSGRRRGGDPRWSGSCGWSSGWRSSPDRSFSCLVHSNSCGRVMQWYILPWESSRDCERGRIMSKSGDSSAGTTKNPEHESGYFEDGSDVETIVEEPIVIEERNYGSTCYTLSKDIDDFDMRDFNEPAPDYDEDRGTTREYFPRKYINGCCSWLVILTR